jgi:peptidoglycan/LPS O-acetylase OafA/YrhL
MTAARTTSRTVADDHRWPALDGARAFAVAAVMGLHLQIKHVLPSGDIGVDVFFVLSGFLITSLLIGEHDKHGSLDLRSFYARRALRLFPALAAVVVLTVLLVSLVKSLGGSARHETLAWLPFTLFYIGNWARVAQPAAMGLLSHTWSLAIEEQFYLIWPIIFTLFATRFRPHLTAVTLAALATADIAYSEILLGFGISTNRVYNGTDTHAEGLLLGCALAFWIASERLPAARPFRRACDVITVAAVGGLVGIAEFLPLSMTSAVVSPLASVLAAIVLFNQVVMPNRLLRWLFTLPAVLWVGKRSYGLYLWHFPVFWYLGTFTLSGSPRENTLELAVLQVGVSVVLAAASYRLLERPILTKWRPRFQRTEALPNAAFNDSGEAR